MAGWEAGVRIPVIPGSSPKRVTGPRLEPQTTRASVCASWAEVQHHPSFLNSSVFKENVLASACHLRQPEPSFCLPANERRGLPVHELGRVRVEGLAVHAANNVK